MTVKSLNECRALSSEAPQRALSKPLAGYQPGINGRRRTRGGKEGGESSRMSGEEEEGWLMEIKAKEFLHRKGRKAEDGPRC